MIAFMNFIANAGEVIVAFCVVASVLIVAGCYIPWRRLVGWLHRPLINNDDAQRYANARRVLCQNSIREHAAGVREETDEFLQCNGEVADAEQGVALWRRVLIDRRILRELDYWKWMQ